MLGLFLLGMIIGGIFTILILFIITSMVINDGGDDDE